MIKGFVLDLQRFDAQIIPESETFTSDGVIYTALEGETELNLNSDGKVSGISSGRVRATVAGTSNSPTVVFDATSKAFDFTVSASGGTLTVVHDDISYSTADRNVSMNFSDTGATCAGGKFQINNAFTFDVTEGSISFDSTTKKFTGATGTVIYLQQDNSEVKIVAKDDLPFAVKNTDDVLKITLNDSKFDFVNGTRTAAVELTGSLVYGSDGSLSLADGTKVNFTWEDGNKLQLTSSGSAGSINFGDEGIKITSGDEKLSLKFTSAAGYTTEVSAIKGSIWYNAGTVIIEENTKLTAKGSIGGQSVDVTLEAIDGDGNLSFGTTGLNYGAGTGKLKITYALGNLESTFIVNSGSVFIGHNVFTIAEGTDLATDLKNFIPALSFTTGDAGTYTINGQTIKTSAKNLALTATDDQMVFKTSADVVEYDGMTFAGNGNVTLTAEEVTLGKDVVANGFGENNSFVLAEAGNVTADAKVFELTELDTPIEIPMEITVTGAQDGFIFSRTLTKESEAYLDDALNEQDFDNYTSPYIGQVFTEKFISAGDSSYRIRTDAIGLEEVIGISNGATITGGATLDDEETLSYYNLITDTEGKFTIGKKTYNVSGDSNVVIRARFDVDTAPYASYFDSLNGTVSGDFTGGEFKINGSSALKILGDTDVSIVADGKNFKILGLDAGASLQVSAAGTYSVNSSVIEMTSEGVIVGMENDSARLYGKNIINNSSSGTVVNGTLSDDYITNSGTAVTISALGGDDYIANDVDSTVTAREFGNSINAGAGNDTIYNHHSYNPTLEGGAGNDSIVVSRGHMTFIDGGEGNDSIIGRLANNPASDWAMGGHATILGGEGNDYISTGYTNDSSIDGGDGDDTIITSGANSTINGGDGANLLQMSGGNAFVVLNGNTTVEGFSTGFGEGSDTIYIAGNPAGVELKSSGMIFLNSTDSLTFSDVTTTAKINIYHERRNVLNKGVFIAEDDWYKVEESDLTVESGEEVYFVGTSTNSGHGVDFSGISSALNVTMDTAYEDSEDFVPGTTMWINSVYSLKGGAGLTTITGSDKSDTILAGSGSTTIDGGEGNDYISLQSSAALINFAAGDGNDTISGFNANSTLSIAGGDYSYKKSGNDVIVTVGDENITLIGAASLKSLNIPGANNEPEEILREVVGADISNFDEVTVTDSKSLEDAISDDSKLLAVSSDSSLKTIDLRGSDYAQAVSLEGGTQIVRFNDEDGNIAIVGKDATGVKRIYFGKGDDVGVFAGAKATSQISLGGGDDSVITSNNANVSVSMASIGAAKIIPYSGKVTLENYNVTTGAAVQTEITDILGAVKDNSIELVGNEVRLNSSTRVKFNDSDNDATLVRLLDSDGNAQIVGFTGMEGGVIDTSNFSDNFLLKGNYAETSADLKNKPSTLIAGSGNDTILAGDRDFINGGAGENQIILTPFDLRQTSNGATVAVTEGNNTVQNFKAGFDNSDRLFFGVNDVIDFNFDGANVSIKNNDSLRGVLSDVASNDPFVNLLATDANSTVKVAVAREGAIITVDDELADFFVGKNSGVDFTDYKGSLFANLGSEEASLGGGEILFSGINQVTLGSGQSTLIGSDNDETLVAGNSFTSIWGGAGSDSLVGSASSSDKTGNTTFFFLAGDGHDTISDFEFFAPDKRYSGTMDKIDITDANAVTNVFASGDDVVLQINDSDDYLRIKDAVGKDFRINNLIAKVDQKNLAYDGLANCYVAKGVSSLTVDSSIGSAEIWLDGSHGTHFLGEIHYLDASAARGLTSLVGNEFDNTISAGQGDSSLWGGFSTTDDLLIGGEARNTFFYCNGNGNDTIQGVNDGDRVILSDVSLDQITGTNIASDSVDIRLTDGGTLKVNSAANVTYQLADGSKYSADHEQLKWLSK